METNLWQGYVLAISGDDVTQAQIAERSGVDQTTIGRWRRGEKMPDAGNAAAFARGYERSPLEAFVAAGLLEESEAGRGLSSASRRLLEELRQAGRIQDAMTDALGEGPDGINKAVTKRRGQR